MKQITYKAQGQKNDNYGYYSKILNLAYITSYYII